MPLDFRVLFSNDSTMVHVLADSQSETTDEASRALFTMSQSVANELVGLKIFDLSA